MKNSTLDETHPSQMKATILVIEDDQAIRRLLNMAFKDTGFKSIEASTGEEGIQTAVQEQPDLILLDLGLPDMTGLDVVKTVRTWSKCPIIVISANGQERLKVECLEAGADDYVTKPFGVAELMARLRVALRREIASTSPNHSSVFEAGPLKVDFAARDVFVNGERIQLTPLEYKLLSVLVKHSGKIVTHRQLLSDIWGPDYVEESQYLRLYVGYLRKKLPDGQKLIINEPGVGYRLVLTEA